jgi:hypothetical protein
VLKAHGVSYLVHHHPFLFVSGRGRRTNLNK